MIGQTWAQILALPLESVSQERDGPFNPRIEGLRKRLLKGIVGIKTSQGQIVNTEG